MDMEDLDHLDRDHQADQLRKEQREHGVTTTAPPPRTCAVCGGGVNAPALVDDAPCPCRCHGIFGGIA